MVQTEEKHLALRIYVNGMELTPSHYSEQLLTKWLSTFSEEEEEYTYWHPQYINEQTAFNLHEFLNYFNPSFCHYYSFFWSFLTITTTTKKTETNIVCVNIYQKWKKKICFLSIMRIAVSDNKTIDRPLTMGWTSIFVFQFLIFSWTAKANILR